jgi:homoserine/homoserine lactone efflux protein
LHYERAPVYLYIHKSAVLFKYFLIRGKFVELNVFLSFAAATAVLIMLPGPSVLLTVAHSLTFGWKQALFFAVSGATLGVAVQLLIAAAGLSSLLNSAAYLFDWLRWAGVVYLIYLGIKQYLSASTSVDLNKSPKTKGLFLQGLVVTILNPKTLIFIAAFLPQFIDQGKPVIIQLLIMGSVFLLITFSITGLWAVLAGKGRMYLQSEKILIIFLKAAGILMITAGAALMFAGLSA